MSMSKEATIGAAVVAAAAAGYGIYRGVKHFFFSSEEEMVQVDEGQPEEVTTEDETVQAVREETEEVSEEKEKEGEQ